LEFLTTVALYNFNVVESYGKWHAPYTFYYSRKGDRSERIVRNNRYNFATQQPEFQSFQNVKLGYQDEVDYLVRRDGKFLDKCQNYEVNGTQTSDFSQCSYQPFQLDPRYGMPTNTTLRREDGFRGYQLAQDGQSGRDSLSEKYTTTAMHGQAALNALRRMVAQADTTPFSLGVHFNHPHPPIIATSKYLDLYLGKDLFVSPSIHDPMINSAYNESNGRRFLENDDYNYNETDKMKELVAGYFGLITEIDDWVGEFLSTLDEANLLDNTIIIYTSDHGEMLGAHGMRNKWNHLEEAVRVPLVLAFRDQIPAGEIVTEPISHGDLFATILDYTGTSEFDRSDGKSLRRYIENTSINRRYDGQFVVCELDGRLPLNSSQWNEVAGLEPNFMIRKANYKLLLPKRRGSKVLDMMYDLKADPYETNNLLGENGMTASYATICKAQHMKALLWEYMNRNDRPGYYSDPVYNPPFGDMKEILIRRTWRAVNLWLSDSRLAFGRPSKIKGRWRQNEWLYIGSTTGPVVVENIFVRGPDRKYFKVHWSRTKKVFKNWWLRIRVEFTSPTPRYVNINGLKAYVEIKTRVPTNRIVRSRIVGSVL